MPLKRLLEYVAGWAKQLDSRLESTLFSLSIFAVPAGLLVLTIASLTSWQTLYPGGHPETVPFRILEEQGAPLTPGTALLQVEQATPVTHKDTFRSERPFWFLFTTRPAADQQPFAVDLPSRHMIDVTCWNAETLDVIGAGSRLRSEGAIAQSKSGHAIAFPNDTQGMRVLCNGRFTGPAHIKVLQWPQDQLESSIHEFHRNAGLLEGGLLLLALFMFATAIINREWTYIIFAGWLVANMRLAAISTGWDTQWLGHWVPYDWLIPVRQLTAAAYYVLTVTLFGRLFRDELKVVGYGWLLRIAGWACTPLLLAAISLPFALWLPILWVASAYGVFIAVFLLGRILLKTRSPVALWYSASLLVTLVAVFAEVIGAAFGLREFADKINFVTASLSSGLLAAFAIGQQMRQERIARLSAQAELARTYDASPIGLFTLDPDGTFLRSNPTITRTLGLDPCAEPPRRWQDLFGLESWTTLQWVINHRSAEEFEVHAENRERDAAPWYLVKATFANRLIEGSLQDITARVTATDKLRFLAEHDPLTNVLNRRGIEIVLERAIRKLDDGGGATLSLAYLDLDRFKLINELFGHAAGDIILREVCTGISEMLSNGCSLGRVGGDEFVFVLPDMPLKGAHWLCRGVVDRILRTRYEAGDSVFQVRGSIGLIEVMPGTTVKDAIAVADRACRQAKRGHHEGLVVFENSEEAFRERAAELRLIGHLDHGLAPEGLFLAMQPIMSLKAPYESMNFEVLLRMREDDGSILAAGPIIAAAENNGRIGVIDRWVLTTTLEWIDAHSAQLGKTKFVCMNLSGASLNDERFIHDAFEIIGRHKEATTRLCIEITEGVALQDINNTQRFINRVRSHGAKIALDDFGAGYTSFSYLKELSAEVLKIDGMFVKGIAKHPANLAIVEAIVALARNLGMRTIAEWSEDAATTEALAMVGIDYVQGYAVSRPVTPEEILKADSAASFVTDPRLQQFLRNQLAIGVPTTFWDAAVGLDPKDMH